MNKKFMFLVCSLLLIIPLSVYATTTAGENPSTEVNHMNPNTLSIEEIRYLMSNTIFNYDTLEAEYTAQNYTYSMAVDYLNNKAYGLIKDNRGVTTMEYLIQDKKVIEFTPQASSYLEGEQLVEKREKPSVSTVMKQGEKYFMLASNPLPLPLGRAGIAIDPEQYALGIMEDSKILLKGNTEFVGRSAEVIEIIPPAGYHSDYDKFEWWIDSETGAILRFIQYNENKVVYELNAKKFIINKEVDQSIFKLDLPRSAKKNEDF